MVILYDLPSQEGLGCNKSIDILVVPPGFMMLFFIQIFQNNNTLREVLISLRLVLTRSKHTV